MITRDERADFDYVVHLIDFKTWRLTRIWRFSDEDMHDLKQDLFLRVFQSLSKFDSRRGTTKTFINRVLNNRLIQILDKRMTVKCGFGKCTRSLDEYVASLDGESIDLADTIDREAYLLHTGMQRRPSIDECELRIEIERVISTLEPELRDMCNRLRTKSMSQISRDMGVPRRSLYSAIRKLRCIFEEAGLRDYL